MERVSSRVIIPPLDIPKRSQLAQGHCPFFDSSTAKTEFTEAVSISDSYYSSSDDDYDGDTHDRKLDVEVFLISRRRELQLIFACAVLQFVASATAVLMGVLSAGFFGIESLGAYAVFLAYSLVALPAIMTIIAIIVFKDHAVPLVVTAVTSTVYHGLVSVGLSVVLSVYINQGTVLAAGTDDEPGADGPTPWMFTPSYLTASCTLLGVYFVIHLVSAAPSTHFAAKYLHQYVYIRRRVAGDQAVLRGLMRDINGTDGTSEMGFSTAPTTPRLTMDGSTGSIQTSPRLVASPVGRQSGTEFV